MNYPLKFICFFAFYIYTVKEKKDQSVPQVYKLLTISLHGSALPKLLTVIWLLIENTHTDLCAHMHVYMCESDAVCGFGGECLERGNSNSYMHFKSLGLGKSFKNVFESLLCSPRMHLSDKQKNTVKTVILSNIFTIQNDHFISEYILF